MQHQIPRMQHPIQTGIRPLARVQHLVQTERPHLSRIGTLSHLAKMHQPIETKIRPLARLHPGKKKICRMHHRQRQMPRPLLHKTNK